MFRLLLGLVLALSVAPTFAAIQAKSGVQGRGHGAQGLSCLRRRCPRQAPGRAGGARLVGARRLWPRSCPRAGRARLHRAGGGYVRRWQNKPTTRVRPTSSPAMSPNLPLMKARFDAALSSCRVQAQDRGPQAHQCGYRLLFGGKVVLDMARQGADLGVVPLGSRRHAASRPERQGQSQGPRVHGKDDRCRRSRSDSSSRR